MPRNLSRCIPCPAGLVLGGMLTATLPAAAEAPRASVDAQVGDPGATAETIVPSPTGWWRDWSGLRASIQREHWTGAARPEFEASPAPHAAWSNTADRFPTARIDGREALSGTLTYAHGPYTGTASVHGYRMPAAGRAFAVEWDLATAFALGTRARYGRMTAKYADYRINNDALTRSATPAQFGNTRTFWLQWEWQWQSTSR